MHPLDYKSLDRVTMKDNISGCAHLQENHKAFPIWCRTQVVFSCKDCSVRAKSYQVLHPRELPIFHMLLKKFTLFLTHQSFKTGYCNHLLLFASIFHDLRRKPRRDDLKNWGGLDRGSWNISHARYYWLLIFLLICMVVFPFSKRGQAFQGRGWCKISIWELCQEMQCLA